MLNFLDGIYTGESDPLWLKKYIKGIMIWYLVDAGFFMVIGGLDNNIQTIFTGLILIFWFILTRYVFLKSRSWKKGIHYIGSVFILAIIEETVIYYNGGGLGGKALSLSHDLISTLPVFTGIALGIYLSDRWFGLYTGEYFAVGATIGLIIEVFLSGSLNLIVFIGGAAMGIYGALMVAVAPENQVADRTPLRSGLLHIVCVVVSFLIALIGPIVLGT